jgi:hypothetical protein
VVEVLLVVDGLLVVVVSLLVVVDGTEEIAVVEDPLEVEVVVLELGAFRTAYAATPATISRMMIMTPITADPMPLRLRSMAGCPRMRYLRIALARIRRFVGPSGLRQSHPKTLRGVPGGAQRRPRAVRTTLGATRST